MTTDFRLFYDSTSVDDIQTLLDFSYNKLITLPINFHNLKQVCNVNLSFNDLKVLPPEFGDMTFLGDLNLSNNINMILPKNFSNITVYGDLNISNMHSYNITHEDMKKVNGETSMKIYEKSYSMPSTSSISFMPSIPFISSKA